MQFISIICLLLIVIGVVDSFQIRSPSIIKSTRSNGRSSSLLMYDVKIINNKVKTEYVAKIPPGGIILDVAETQGIAIPYSCRAGSCSSCVGKLLKGSVDQSGQIFLTDKQIDDGFVLTCAATALSDCEIEVDIEDMFYALNPDMVS